MTQEQVLDRTRQYIRDNFLYTRPDYQLDESEPLMEAGVIDSMGVMELLDFIQEEFGVVVEDDEITEENLGTLGAIARYVSSKQGTAAAEA